MVANRRNDSAACGQHGNNSNNALFPWQLQKMLTEVSAQGRCDVVSWLPNGKAFKVHKVNVFVEEILPSYFKQTKYKSFQRQCNLWGFERMTSLGIEKGAYWHPDFVLDHPGLCRRLTRQKATKKSSSSSTKKTTTTQKVNVVVAQQPRVVVSQVPNIPAKNPFIVPTMTKEITASFTTDVISVLPIESSYKTDHNQVVSDDDESLPCVVTASCVEPSVVDTIPAVDFEGCTFFPLDLECYQEMTRRISTVIQGTTDAVMESQLKEEQGSHIISAVPSTKDYSFVEARPIKKSLIALH